MAKTSEKTTLRETWRLHWRAYRELRRYCPGLFAVNTLHRAAKALGPYVTIWLSAQLINELAGPRRPELLRRWALLALLSAAVLTLLTGALEHAAQAYRERCFHRKEHMFADKLLTMDFADVDRTETRDLLAQIQQNQQWSNWGFNKAYDQFEKLAEGLFGVMGAVALTVSLFTQPVPQSAGRLTVLNHPLFLVGLVGLLALITVAGPMCRNRATAYEASCAEEAKLDNRVFSAFGMLGWEQEKAMDCRMYRQERICHSYMSRLSAFNVHGEMAEKAKGVIGVWEAASLAVGSVLTGLVYVFVCLKAWAGAFGVGSVTQYVGAVTALSGNISRLIEAVGTMKSNVPFLRTAFEFLDIPNSMYQGSLTTEKRSDRQYEVEFRDVSFRYPGSTLWALRHVSMKFRVGRRLAVVGENGSGKTTFIKLLCRLYDPTEGQILLNGIDIRKYNYRDYLDLFSVVFQDFQLISQPLGANVAGSMEYDRDRVRKALVDAGFGERLADMPEGLDTMLYKDFAKDGVDVSGGEAQKIAIARALYKDAPFIVLDEPTAALDPIAEAEIYSKFNAIAGDKTAIYISHRLSSCKFCDEIAVFHEGAVIQQGTHDGLLADEGGKYYALWHAQAQYYAEKRV